DIIISALSRHPVDYFEKTMQYALDEKLGKYIRYYLIEAIGKWYAIDENNRKDALRKILENTPNNYIKTVVQQTMEEF
ncbi:hypothetical protein K0V43_18495, partial [Leptospira sp. id769339]|nr:hypothetical protein [Leptospira sp. id769339]